MPIARTHRRPKRRDLEKRFGLFEPQYINFYPIFQVNELGQFSHCPRKAFMILRRGENINENIQLNRNLNNQGDNFSWQGNSFWFHSRSFRKVLLNILPRLGSDLNFLRNQSISSQGWNQVISNEIRHVTSSEYASPGLISDIENFLLKWKTNNYLENFFQNPESIFYEFNYFNPSLRLESTHTTDINRGICEGLIPIKGTVDIFDTEERKLINLLCISDSWIPPKEEYIGTILEDDPQGNRRDLIIYQPYKLQLWLSWMALSKMEPTYFISAILGTNNFGRLGGVFDPFIQDFPAYTNTFSICLETIDRSHFVNTDTQQNQIFSQLANDGIFSSRLAYHNNFHRLMNEDDNPCRETNLPFRRDPHCSMRNFCAKKPIGFLVPDVSMEIKRLERRVFHERVLNKDWVSYRISTFLPNEVGQYLSVFNDIWIGEVIENNPLKIQLSYSEETGLSVNNNYEIFQFSVFIGPKKVMKINEIDGITKIITFDKNYDQLSIGTKIIFKSAVKKLDLERKEQSSLFYQIYSWSRSDTRSQEGIQRIFEILLEKGGRRTGQALFGGMAEFL